MIVVHVIAGLDRGGAEVMLKRLIEAQASNGELRHHVISLDTLGSVGPEIQALGVPVEALGMSGAAGIPAVIARLVRRFRALRPDIVHAWMYRANLLAGLAARIARVPHVIWGIRASSLDKTSGVTRQTLAIRKIAATVSSRLPDVIIYVADSARAAHEAIGYAPAKGVVIPNGYLPPKPSQTQDARAALGLVAEHFVVGSVGRYNAAKDPRTFVEAAALVSRRYPNARFMMVGLGMSRDNSELTKWIAELGIEDRFLLCGEHIDIDAMLESMDLFCLHSTTEAFPNVLAEAMRAGLPCVSTDVGDAARLLADGGIIVRPADPVALADAISGMIELGANERRAYGERGRERIRMHYSISAIAARYDDLYRRVGAGELAALPSRSSSSS